MIGMMGLAAEVVAPAHSPAGALKRTRHAIPPYETSGSSSPGKPDEADGTKCDKECQLCGARAGHAHSCEGCGAMHYCSDKHKAIHWKTGHSAECSRMGQQMDKWGELCSSLPPAFLGGEGLEGGSVCDLLSELGVHGKGFWKWECPCWSWGGGTMDSPSVAGEPRGVMSWEQGWSCSKAWVPHPGVAPVGGGGDLASWGDYYKLRGLEGDSPAAALLHGPLTMYHAMRKAGVLARLQEQLQGGAGEGAGGAEEGSRGAREVPPKVEVHLLGPEKEIDQMALWAEIGALVPGVHINLRMIGPRVPKWISGREVDLTLEGRGGCSSRAGSGDGSLSNSLPCGGPPPEGFGVVLGMRHRAWSSSLATGGGLSSRSGEDVAPRTPLGDTATGVRVTTYHGYYHDVAARLPKPDLVFCPNAGLAAYMEWLPTILRLVKVQDPPAVVVTDYNEEAAVRAIKVVEHVDGSRATRSPEVNPFRQPLRLSMKDNSLPSFSNCFLVCINCPEGAGGADSDAT